MTETDVKRAVMLDYTNYLGERRERLVLLQGSHPLVFRSTPHHPEQQWCLNGFDPAKNAARTFAMKDVHSWRMPTEADWEALLDVLTPTSAPQAFQLGVASAAGAVDVNSPQTITEDDYIKVWCVLSHPRLLPGKCPCACHQKGKVA